MRLLRGVKMITSNFNFYIFSINYHLRSNADFILKAE